MRFFKYLLLALAVSTLAACASTGHKSGATASKGECLDSTPLPDDISIQTQDAAPAAYADFLGMWTGRWGDPESGLCGTLVVTAVHEDGTAEVIYSWAATDSFEAGYGTPPAQVTGDTLEVTLQGPTAVYTSGEDTLSGKYSRGNTVWNGTFHPVSLPQ